MADPPDDRLSYTEEKLSEHYKKDKEAAGIHGQTFECKFCALVFLRAKNKGQNFELDSNVKGLGMFDDVVEYLDHNSRKSLFFVQLKNKLSHTIKMEQLLAEKGDFSLRKYYESYIQIEEKFSCSEEEVKIEGRINERQFILYTNADVEEGLKSTKEIEFGEAGFLRTGGSVLQFNEEEHKAIYQHLQELPKLPEFLGRFRIFYSQADEREMDWHIKSELQQSMEVPESELDLAYMCFINFMMDWCQNPNYFLKDNNSKENDILEKTKEKVRTTFVAKVLHQRKTELDDLSIKYKQSAITDMKQLTETHKAVLIFAPGSSTTLTAAKIHQMLSDTEHVMLNLQQLIRYKTEVMLAWKTKFDVLVLESDSSAEVSVDLFIELCDFLNNSVVEKRFIFVSNKLYNIHQISDLRRTFHTILTEKYDVCKFTDIVTASQMHFLDKKVYFQGLEVKLSTIIKNGDVGVLNELDCDSISLLLENEKPSIGIRSEDTVEYYINRTLQRRKHAKTRFPSQGEEQHASSEDNLHAFRDSSPHFEENLKRETDRVWKPSILIEGEGRINLVTDEPGTGKSTFLTHLAKETRERHPDLWIVRVNINNYTRILNEFQTNGCDQKGVFKLLTKAALIKESGGVVLEERLFDYTYNSTGNMAVLIDAVEEVSPHYTEQVIQVLKILSKTKIKGIWLTSRNSVRDRLETELQCHSYSLVPFSEEDQKSFLVKFWNKTRVEKTYDFLEDLANRVVQLSTEHLTVQDKQFMGIPLQSLLVAEMFEGNLKQCSSAGTVELPEYINVVMLYDLYVEKKWDIYLSEKKKSDRTNVNALNGDEALHKTFIHNHMAAALVAILSTQQLEKITDKKIAEGARVFLQKITAGIEKTGIIIDVIEGRPVFQHRTLAEYLAAIWLCDNYQNGQIFMRDHLFESGFHVVRSMVDKILADKYPLHEAVLNSDMRHVARLLERKESIKQKDRGGRTPLHVAVSCRILEFIRLLLEHGAGVSSVDTLLGLSPAQYAIRMADWEVLSLLMEKRSDIREQVLNEMTHGCTEYNSSALRAAARYGHTDLLRYLLNKGNCVNMVFQGDSGTLLHEAARGNHIQTVRTLVDLGANCDIQDEIGKTALHVSAETGSLEVAKFIVQLKEIPSGEVNMKHNLTRYRPVNKLNRLNVRDKDGNTPLHLAVAAGKTSTVRYLLSAGSELRSCNRHGEYPLNKAALNGDVEVVRELLKHGAEVESADKDGWTLLISAGFNDHVEVVRELLKHGAKVESTNNEGWKPLSSAAFKGHVDVVRELLKHDAKVESINNDGWTPLMSAASKGHVEVVRELLKHGAKVEIINNDGWTALMNAAFKGHVEVVRELLKHGAELESANNRGWTPLTSAAYNGHVEVVRELLKHGAKVESVNNNGWTPLNTAARRGHMDVVRELQNHGASV